MNLQEATAKAEESLPEGFEIIASMEKDGDFLFLIDDGSEDNLDPFMKVNAESGEVSDFSPQDYENPEEIFKGLGF